MSNFDINDAVDLLQERYGFNAHFRINPLVNEVNIAPTKIFSHNPKRVGYIVVNLSVNPIYVCFDNAVSAARGIYIAPNGGAFVTMVKDDFILCTLELWGMSTANNQDIFVVSVEIARKGGKNASK